MLRPRLRLLHTSDVHLGAYDYRGAAEASRTTLEAGFRRVIDIGIAEGVDAAAAAISDGRAADKLTSLVAFAG